MDKIPILKRRAEQQQSSTATISKSDDKTNNTSSTNNMSSATTNTTNNTTPNNAKDPICVIVVGMAGSGKTTLMAQLQKSLNLKARAEKEESDIKKSSSDADVSLCYVCLSVVNVYLMLHPCIDILMSLVAYLQMYLYDTCILLPVSNPMYSEKKIHQTQTHQKGQGMQ